MEDSKQELHKNIPTPARVIAVVLLSLIFSLGVYFRFAHRETGPGPQNEVFQIAERLVVVGKYYPELRTSQREQLTNLALQMETDEELKALIRGEPSAELDKRELSLGYTLMLEQSKAPDPLRLKQLRILAMEGLLRLQITAGLLGGLWVLCLITFFLPRREASEPYAPVGFGIAGILGLFFLWDFCGFWVAGVFVGLLPEKLDRFTLILLSQVLLYAAMLVLLREAGVKEPGKAFGSLNWPWVGGGYILALVSVFTVNFLVSQVMGRAPQSENPVLQLFLNVPAWKVGLLGLLVVVVGPIFEEIMFRGWLYGGLRGRLGDFGAAAFSSLLFAAIHGDGPGFPALFVLGMIFCLVYRKSGSLYGCMIVHALWNATTFSLLLSALP